MPASSGGRAITGFERTFGRSQLDVRSKPSTQIGASFRSPPREELAAGRFEPDLLLVEARFQRLPQRALVRRVAPGRQVHAGSHEIVDRSQAFLQRSHERIQLLAKRGVERADLSRLAWEEAERRLPSPAEIKDADYPKVAAGNIEPAFAGRSRKAMLWNRLGLHYNLFNPSLLPKPVTWARPVAFTLVENRLLQRHPVIKTLDAACTAVLYENAFYVIRHCSSDALQAYTGKLGGPVGDLVKLVGEVVSVERAPITFDVQSGKGTLKVGNAGYAELMPYEGSTGKQTTLSDTIFSTVPGAPVFVGKAPRYISKNEKLGIDIDLKGHNALQSVFAFDA